MGPTGYVVAARLGVLGVSVYLAVSNVTAFQIAEASFKECQHVHEFLNARVRPRLEHALGDQPTKEQGDFHGLFLRALGWLRSLWKLNEPADFQAVTVASRTLCEIAIDVTLLHFDNGNYPHAKMLAWEQSAKLHAAMSIRRFFDERGETPTREFRSQIAFLAREQVRVERLRVQYWPDRRGRGRHPPRWTGRDLGTDASAATALFPEGEFDRFYATRYPQLCWNTHGSGLGGVRGLPQDQFPGLSALAFRECVHFAVVMAEVVMRHLALWDAALAVEFDDHSRYRTLMTSDALLG